MEEKLVGDDVLLNVSRVNRTNIDETDDGLSTWILYVFFANIACGALLNSLSFVAIMRSKHNGVLAIVVQLTGADVLASLICVVEIWALQTKTWPFPLELCPLFSGAEILINTLTLYLIIALNFHTISLCNSRIVQDNRNPLTSCDSSNECLVRDSRTITIDYRKTKRELSTILPSILVWFICLSLSIPQFTLSSTIKMNDKVTSCTFVDVYYGKLLQNLLMFFRVLIPITLIVLTTAVICWKLYVNSRKDTLQNIFNKKADNILYYFIFCLVLTLVYLFTSLQRCVLYSMHTVSINSKDALTYEMPPLYNNCLYRYLTLLLSMLHYSGTFFRFLIYVFLLPKFKAMFCNKIFICFKSDE